jgi:hypothetical protein
MAKICPACQAENRDEAQFCRTCGTPFPLIPSDPPVAAGAPCTECGFANKPGVRYCAKCGVNLMGTVVVPRSQRPPASPPAPDGARAAYAATASYPPGQTPTYVPPPSTSAPAAVDVPIGVEPHDPYASTSQREAYLPPEPPQAPATTWPPGGAPAYAAPDPLQTPDVPDPRLALEAEKALDDDRTVLLRPPVGVGFGAPPPPPPPRRTGLWAGLAVAVIVAAGVAWYFLRSGTNAPPAAQVEAASQPAASASAPAPEASTAATDAAAASAAAALAASAPAAATLPASANDAAATTPAPQAATEAAPSASGPTEEERLAAEKRAKEKAARDRAEREARAKAAAEQREQAAARQRAEQEAAAAAAAQQRARSQPPPAPAPVATPAPAPYARTVAEICAGRNLISKSMCESRECGAPEHAGEAVCRKIREQEERHREGGQ